MMDKNSYIGNQIGNYRIIAEIGSGGFARVYRGEHILLKERVVAIKLLHITCLNSQHERDQFLHEAKVLERLKHPHILSILDAGLDRGLPYLVVEYASNGTLQDRLKQQFPHPLSLQEAMRVLKQVGQALQYAHQQNIIHRDLKPANILFNAQNEVLLADFGIATILADTSVKHTSHLVGTPAYMAPEQFVGKAYKSSDQYALGMIAYELFTGHRPSSDSPSSKQFNPNLPIHIEQAIFKAMAKEPLDRYDDVSAFIVALDTLCHQKTVPVISQIDTFVVPASQPPTATSISTFKTSQKATKQWLDDGEALYKAGRYEEALQAYEQIIRLNPNFADAYYLKGNALKCLESFEEASAAYQQAIHLNPNFTLAYIAEGNRREHFKRYEEALYFYQEAIRVAPKVPHGYYNKGNALAELSRYDEALEAYDAAIRCDDHFLDTYCQKGNLLERLKRNEDALTTYNNAISIASNFTDAYYRKGNLLESLERFENALTTWRQLIRVAPKLADAYYRKGQVLVTLELREQRLKKVRKEPKLKGSGIPELNQQSNRGIYANQELDNFVASAGRFEQHQQEPKIPKPNQQKSPQDIGRNQELDDVLVSKGYLKSNRKQYKKVKRKKDIKQVAHVIHAKKELENSDMYDLFRSNSKKLRGHREKQELGIFDALKARITPRPRYKKALVAYEQAIILQPNYSPYYEAKGDVLKYLGRVKEANQAYKKGDQLQSNKAHTIIKKGNRLRINKNYEWIFPLFALNPLSVPIAFGILHQSWWIFGGALLSEIVLIVLCSRLGRRLRNTTNTILASFADFPIRIGWGFVNWLFVLFIFPEFPLTLAIAGFLIGFFGNVFTLYVIDDWSIWDISKWFI